MGSEDQFQNEEGHGREFGRFRRMESQPWWKTCLISCGKGLLALEGTDLECGAVLFLRETARGRVLMAQKNPRDGYVFSGLWVLPGGMMRELDPRVEEAQRETAEESGSRFIQKRVAQETGLEIEGASLHALRDPCHGVPPVTCYQAGRNSLRPGSAFFR
jgi:hypothetical protein